MIEKNSLPLRGGRVGVGVAKMGQDVVPKQYATLPQTPSPQREGAFTVTADQCHLMTPKLAPEF